MPFDVTILSTYDDKPDPRIARRRELIASLHRQPTGEHAAINGKEFRWNFAFCLQHTACGFAGCAIGLANLLWPELRIICRQHDIDLGGENSVQKMAAALGLRYRQAVEIFWCADTYGKVSHAEVTPQMVAAKLEEFGDEIIPALIEGGP